MSAVLYPWTCRACGGLGRTERTRETRNDFIDAVIDGMIGTRGRPIITEREELSRAA